MRFRRIAVTITLVASLSACTTGGLNTQSYPGRTQLQFMSADQVTLMSYACIPGDGERQTQRRGAQAHAYVDGALRSARARFGGQSGFGALGAAADLNAEIARISQNVEREYRCAFLGERNSNSPFG
ncbi:MAG: hypothetical protein AAFU41_17215 [Pseudomonadota bacterium]